MNKQRYSLTLGDGSSWGLWADKELDGWINELGTILSVSEKSVLSPEHSICFHSYCSEELTPNRENIERELCSKWDEVCFYENPPVHLLTDRMMQENIVTVSTSFLHLPEMYYLNMSKAMLPFFLHSFNNGGVPLHAALVEYDGAGILIAATGDTGKTTCCRRLPGKRWKAHSDDLSLLIRNQEGGLVAHPMPTWSDYMIRGETGNKWGFEKKMPIKAIFLLEQSSVDAVTRLPKLNSTVQLMKSVRQICVLDSISSPHLIRKINSSILKNVTEIAEEIPVYTLEATLDGKFWEAIAEVL